jgi:hypothetical protein
MGGDKKKLAAAFVRIFFSVPNISGHKRRGKKLAKECNPPCR